MPTSQEFICKCKQMKAWITEGEDTSPCPVCGRQYRGRYNQQMLGIEAVEIEENNNN